MKRMTALLMSEVIALSLILTGIGVTLLSASQRIQHSGEVTTIGLELSTYNMTWSNLDPNSSRIQAFEVMPTGTKTVTLTMTVGNWTPANAYQYLKVNWNYTGATLQPNQWTPLELTLTAYSNATALDTFSFDTVITAEET